MNINKYLLPLMVACILSIYSTQTNAQTMLYYALGEDIDNIINNDEASVLTQIEEEILEYPLLRKLHGYFCNVEYIDADENGDVFVAGSDESSWKEAK